MLNPEVTLILWPFLGEVRQSLESRGQVLGRKRRGSDLVGAPI